MRHWKIIGAVISILFWLAMQLSGFTSLPLAIILWVICAILLFWSAWPLRKRVLLKKGGPKMLILGSCFTAIDIVGIFMVASALHIPKQVVSTITTQTANPSISTSTTPNIQTFIDLSKLDPTQKMTFSLDGVSLVATLGEMENGLKRTFSINSVTFVAYVTDGKFYVDTSLYGGQNIAPVQIKGNEFVVKPANWDKNYDANALEVVNQDGDVIFQLIYESSYHIVIYGIFPYPGGIAYSDKTGFRSNDPYHVLHLNPIFKYPSSEYQGQRITP